MATSAQTMKFSKKCKMYGYDPTNIISKALLKTTITTPSAYDNTISDQRHSKTKRGMK